MYTRAKDKRRGDATLVADITTARGLNGGRGYSRTYVQEVLGGTRRNADIHRIHAEIVALRTPKHNKR